MNKDDLKEDKERDSNPIIADKIVTIAVKIRHETILIAEPKIIEAAESVIEKEEEISSLVDSTLTNIFPNKTLRNGAKETKH